MNRIPRYVYYIIIAVSIVFALNIIANNAYDHIGYVETKASHLKYLETSNEHQGIDSLTITLEVISNEENNSETDSLKPNVIKKIQTPNVERKITFSADKLDTSVSDSKYFQLLKENYIQDIIKEIPSGKSRTDLVVRYYKRKGDGKDGIYELNEMRYYIHEREVTDNSMVLANNSIFYGDNIKKEDIQIVAYTLLTNGIPIKSIKPSKYSSDWKSNSIEIASDASLSDKNVLTLTDVRTLLH